MDKEIYKQCIHEPLQEIEDLKSKIVALERVNSSNLSKMLSAIDILANG